MVHLSLPRCSVAYCSTDAVSNFRWHSIIKFICRKHGEHEAGSGEQVQGAGSRWQVVGGRWQVAGGRWQVAGRREQGAGCANEEEGDR
ncbi:hypothetical protein CLOM_g11349 [Closterium sp. NIES-68]|nr:hypothetical protein CLOM_g11349 [Closterium sp. NIES-68]GJP76707.1 hypothetical protein CLOP_g7173 [Closterium sp. NIES-67]GJP81423.1 hypothetical protein CLOP_g11574 [Closterium sp. NIES-67]